MKDQGAARPLAAAVVAVSNAKGLHARPASKFAKLVQSFDAVVTVDCNGERAEGDSIMDLLMLGAAPGAELLVQATGPDAEAAVAALAGLVRDGFGEA